MAGSPGGSDKSTPKRWVPCVIGVGVFGQKGISIRVLVSKSESELIGAFEEMVEERSLECARYGATRSFDEMVLKGRFTNARRAFH